MAGVKISENNAKLGKYWLERLSGVFMLLDEYFIGIELCEGMFRPSLTDGNNFFRVPVQDIRSAEDVIEYFEGKHVDEDGETNYNRVSDEIMEYSERVLKGGDVRIEIRRRSGFDDKEKVIKVLSNKGNYLFAIWRAYRDSMVKRRSGTELSFGKFLGWLEAEGTYVYQDLTTGWLIGQFRFGVFKVSHFAPFSSRSGVEMMKDVLKYDNIVLFVTDDLKDMLVRLGWISSDGVEFEMEFRGSSVIKHVVTSSKSLMMKIKILKKIYDIGKIDLHGVDNLIGSGVKDITSLIKSLV